MTFVKASPGGYTDKITGPTAKQLNHIQLNLADALKGNRGGSYSPIGAINIDDSSGGGLGGCVLRGRLRMRGTGSPRIAWKIGTLPNTNNQTLGIYSGGQILRFAPAAAIRQHQMDNTGASWGDWILFISDAGSGNTLGIYKAGAAPGYAAGDLIVQCAAGAHVCVKLFYDGINWRLAGHSPSATAGAAA